MFTLSHQMSIFFKNIYIYLMMAMMCMDSIYLDDVRKSKSYL